jgi:hypothetical protein
VSENIGRDPPADRVHMRTPATKASRFNVLRMVRRKYFVKNSIPMNTVYALNVQIRHRSGKNQMTSVIRPLGKIDGQEFFELGATLA